MTAAARAVSYQLRATVASDFEFVFRLRETNMRPLVELLRGWNEEAERADMAGFFSPGDDSIIVVDDADAGHLRVAEEAARTHLRMIALLPAWQGQGIGSEIIGDLMRAAHARGVPLTLWVDALNERAFRLYRRLGFDVMRAVDFGPKGVKIEMATRPRPLSSG